jgi:hypothetical protein
MNHRTKLFADVMIPGTERVAVQRVFAGLRVAPWEATEHLQYVFEALPSPAGIIGKRRVWWRIKDAGGTEHYVNLDPAEYRTSAPEGDAIVLDPPDMPPRNTCRDLLEAAIAISELSPATGGYYRDLLSTAKAFLKDPEAVANEGRDRVRSFAPLMREASPENVAKPLGGLYYECLHCPRFDQVSFGATILLLQLQRMTNEWIQGDWLESPGGFLKGFLWDVSQEPGGRDRLATACEEIADHEYREARRTLTEALNTRCLASMGPLLTQAHHRFLMVHLLQVSAADCGVEFRLPRTKIVIEESAICTQTGLTYGAGIVMANHPNYIPEHIRDKAAEGGSDEFGAAISWGSTHVRPFVNRSFARVIGAHAMTLAEEREKVRRGLGFLIELRSGLVTDDTADEPSFELGWLDHALLRAYRKLGMEDEAKRLAVRIAGRALVSCVLSHRRSEDER